MKKLGLVLLTFASSMTAWAQVTTAHMGGVISNGTNSVEGASISAVLTTTNAKYNGESRTGGVYDLTNLQAGGPYTVTVSDAGGKSVTFSNIFLQLGETYRLDVDLSQDGGSIGSVTITSNRKGTQTGASFNISGQTLNTLPTIRRSINDFTRLTPQAGGNSSFNGRDGRMNNITIDGANFNNNFGLSTNNMPGGDAQPISLDAIEAVQVNVSPFDVRQSNFTGAGVNAITKSGSNVTSASIYSFVRNQNFNGTKIGDVELTNIPESTSNILGFRVGGAIKQDKLFYFLSYEQEDRSFPGLLWEPTNANSDPNNPNLSRVLESDLIAVQQHLKDKYGYETGPYAGLGNFSVSNYKILGRLDWNLSDKHKLTARYNYVENTNQQVTNGRSAPNPRSSSNRWSQNAMSYENTLYGFLNTVGSISLELKSNLNKRVNNQLLVTRTNVTDARNSGSEPFPFVDIKKDGDQYIAFGYELFSWNNKVVNNTTSIIDNITMNLNQHTVTAGIAYDNMYVGNSFLRYGTSYYRYDSLNQFLNDMQPSVYAVTYGYNGEKNPVAELGFGQLAVYAQDEYRVNRNLKVTAGIRVDRPVYLTTPLANDGFSKFYDSATFKTPTGEDYLYNPAKWPEASLLISPRVGFNYDVKGDKSLVVRGGTGIFTGRLPFVWYTNQPTNAYGLQATVELTNKAALDAAGVSQFNPDPYAYVANLPQTPANLPNGASFALVDQNFKFPQVWRTSFGIDTKLPGDIDFTADVIYSKSVNDIYQFDANFKGGDTTFFTGTAYEVEAYKDRSSRSYTGSVRNAMVLANTNQGHGLSISATASKTWENGMNAFLSYSMNNTYDITANPGSQAASAWSNNAIGGMTNQNTPALGISQYSTPNRLVGGLSYKKEWNDMLATTFSVVYEGYNQGRYNYTYSNDINNDGLTNDLIFVHKGSDINFKDIKNSAGDVIASASEQAAAWDAFVAQDPYLSQHVGEYTERYQAIMPWFNQLDLAIYQDIAKNIKGNNHKLQLSANILNVGNLLNSSWGVRQMLTVNNGAVLKYNSADNTYNFNLVNNQLVTSSFRDIVSTSSTWAMQLGARYIF